MNCTDDKRTRYLSSCFKYVRVRRFSFQPVCGDLQSQILKCYRENTGKTLDCSSIASAYMQCVDDAKKVQLNFIICH